MKPPIDETALQNKFTIVLIGMMGAGKSSVGVRLAQRLKLPFFDSDHEIEKAAGMPAGELFQRHGVDSFREGEHRVIRRLLDGPPHILATGGGAITTAATRTLIKEKSVSIWLQADPDVLLRRATRRNTRPLLAVDDPEATLRQLMAERQQFYAAADIHVESQPGPHKNTVDFIVDRLLEYLKDSDHKNAEGINS